MYLKSLALRGFKSFADRTNMSFDPGLSVVVGPNGSGKSNISDAILWVLGEQSAKQLRGQAMEDVIFAGSSARQPVGLAEVTLVLDNSDHTLPIDFEEVGITRRMYRSGESEYLINHAPARLRDIQDILHDSGLGKDTHSIISQGNLDSVLSSRPEDRRSLIEEAADISKHRRRKVRSERKLQSMHQNLLRAKDISREVHRQLRPLARQVERAQQAGELRGCLSQLSTALAVDDLRRLQEAYSALKVRDAEAQAQIELARFQQQARQGELDHLQSVLEEKGLYVGDLGAQRRRAQGIVSRIEADIRLLDEKSKNMYGRLVELQNSVSNTERQRESATAELERLAKDMSETRAQIEYLTAELAQIEPQAEAARSERDEVENTYTRLSAELRDTLKQADAATLEYARLRDEVSNAEVEDSMFASRLAQIDETRGITSQAHEEWAQRKEAAATALAAARAQAEDLAAQTERLEAQLESARNRLDAAREELSSSRASLGAMKAVDEAAEEASPLVAELTHAQDMASLVQCRLNDLVEAPPELAGVVERLLGEDLSALVVADAKDLDTLSACARAKLDLGGVATLVPLSGSFAAKAKHAGSRLVDRLDIDARAADLFESLLGNFVVTNTLEEAIAAHAADQSCSYVSLDDATVYMDGRVRIGQETNSASGSLERKRQIRSLERGMSALEKELADSQSALEETQASYNEVSANMQTVRSECARLEGELQGATAELSRLAEQLDRADAERAEVEQRRSESTKRLEDARPDLESRKRAADEASERAGQLTREIDALAERREAVLDAEAKAQATLSESRLNLATVNERARYLENRSPELSGQIEVYNTTVRLIEEEVTSIQKLLLRVDPLKSRYSSLLESAQRVSARLADRANLEQADSESLRATINEAREKLAQATRELETASTEANNLKVEEGRLEVQVESAIQAIQEDGHMSLEEALELPAPEDRAADEREVARLTKALADIGPVNEVALEQYNEIKERADYIDEQVEDLEAASKSLSRISAAIDRKMREAFVSTFQSVNENFEDIFAMLFPGGQAHLELTDPDNPTESGVEVVAQPRGKRLAKMSLLSGGEKSLTALALLFAVYRTRTVPFYVFDEVEAALDDSNLDRLLHAIDILKEDTQLIVISHQRRTMEKADVLWGVSMHADGVSHVVSQRLDQSTGKVVDA